MTIIQQLEAYMETHGVSQNALAQQIGIASSTFSQFLNGTYAGNRSKIEQKAAEFLAREDIRAYDVRLPHVDTAAMRRVQEACALTHSARCIGVVTGDSGVGKTHGVRYYTTHQEGVTLLEAGVDWTARVTFARLAKALGIESPRQSVHDLFEVCVERLRGSDRLVIVDEAEHLPYRALELLRRLHDKAGCGLLLCGMPKLESNLKGHQREYAQLYSRVRVAVKILGLTEEDVETMVQTALSATSGVWRHFYEASRIKDQVNIRRLETLVQHSARIARLNNITVTKQVVRAAKDLTLS